MNNIPLVSAIIIFLNGEQFIEESIESILAQTHRNLELLLVDDGSTDGSTTIAQQYVEKYPEKVKYLEHDGHENRGMSASRNLGISHSKGDFIAFLDADDVWLPQKIEQQIDVFCRYPEAIMVYGRSLLWYSWDGHANSQHKDYFFNLGVQPDTLIQPPKLLRDMLTNKYQKPTPCNAIIRREAFETLGYFEESFRSMYEDQVFYTKVMFHHPVYVADNYWAKYRQHSESCTAQSEKQSYYEVRKPFLEWVKYYFESQEVKYLGVNWILRWELWKCYHPHVAHKIHQVFSYLSYLNTVLGELLKREYLLH